MYVHLFGMPYGLNGLTNFAMCGAILFVVIMNYKKLENGK